jgi:alpha-N-arabinofuranosidase
MRRRTFLKSASAVAAQLCARPIYAADAEVELNPQQAGVAINPHSYGHFIEHLGGVIYDGIWVGENSKIPNIGGIRRRFVEEMRRIGAPNLRWPGGCFADGYHWRDGIGPAARRPRTHNYWERSMPAGLRATEPNHFGIHEFVRLCRLIGAEPYVAANVGSGNPREFHDWVSYCNAPAGTLSLAGERAANGDKEPFNVKYWGVGNESWGCGGNMRPEEYARLYRLFITQFPAYTPPFMVACGPRGHSADSDLGWTTGFFQGLEGTRAPLPDGFGLHFYTDFRNTQTKAGEFTPAAWYTAFHKGLRTEDAIVRHWDAMGKFDSKRRTRFVVDEWGLWYPSGSEIAPGYILSQTITLRDALHTALTFDVFNRHADKVAMANVAQTINCLHSLFLAHEDKFLRTPVYHVFDMYRPHMGARSVPLRIKMAEIEVPVLDGRARIPGLSGSASLRDKRLFVTLTNFSLDAPAGVRLNLGDGRARDGRGLVLTHPDRQATNTWSRPEEVKPAPFRPQLRGSAIALSIPRQSVVSLELDLA